MDIIQGLIETKNPNRTRLRIVNTSGTLEVVATNETTPTLPTEIVPSGASAMPTEISVVGATSGTIGTTERFISFPYSGTATTKDYTFMATENLICDILIVGGGGAGGYDRGAGGGAGACIIALSQSLNAGNYTIKVGNGGVITNTYNPGGNGINSEIYNSANTLIYRATGGGGGASANGVGASGGCGGGAGSTRVGNGGTASTNIVAGNTINANTYASTYAVLGNRGGNSSVNIVQACGGGGIGATGGDQTNSSTTSGASGGNGLFSVIINTVPYNLRSYFTNNGVFGVQDGSTGNYYIGGGGGGGNTSIGSLGGNGGLGGGGKGGNVNTTTSVAGINGTGGGGGGGAGRTGFQFNEFPGANGGSGIVIIRYRKPPSEISGTTDRYISFPYSGTGTTKDYTITTTEALSCDILMVGGGGSGSETHGGGGGAGAVIFMTNVIMNGGYTIKVGKGGVCQVSGHNGLGGKGNNSEIFKTDNINNKIVAEGGGGGGQLTNANGGSGGSGGGGDAYDVAAGVGGAATPYTPILDGITGIKYGNNGGNAFGNPGHGGGGGGAGGVGENALAGNNSGNNEAERAHGGVGIKSATINSVNYDFKTLFGTNTGGGVLEADGFLYFGGGGGNGRWKGVSNNGEGGNGGLGGGGKGGWGGGTSTPNNGKGYPGINGTGGGGGGGGDYAPVGGDGGTGIVIIRYRKAINTITNTIFSILNGGSILADTTVYSNIASNYIDTSATASTGISVSTGISSQWSSNVSKIYYNTSNVGIGTIDPVAPLHIYNTTNTRLLLDTTTNSVASLEFRRGTGADMQNDYRFINDTDTYIKLQIENSAQLFGNTSANLAWFSSNETIIHKNISMNGRVGIGTTYHATRSLDVLGNANISGAVSVGGLSVIGSNMIITNSLTSNTSLTIQNGLIPQTSTSSFIEFIRGTAGDANRDYKLGNYNAEFKIISSTTGVDTDYIKITTAGAITNPTGTASWNTGSDRRIKENIERASYDKCFDNINRLELNRFNYIDGFNTVSRDNKQLGFIAQEVYDIFPKAISSHEYYSDTLNIPDLLSIDVSQINYSLYGAVKKLIEINDEDKEKLASLDNRIKTITNFLNISLDASDIVIDTSNIAIE